jgi:hypothetical protein
MKKLFVCLLFGLFLYGCSEINEPVQVKENNSVSRVLQDNNIQNKTIATDSVRMYIMSDSLYPPLNSLNIVDSSTPPLNSSSRSSQIIPQK